MIRYVHCKEASRLISDAMERRLSFVEWLGLKIHLFLCRPCVNYTRQLQFMRKAVRSSNENVTDISTDKMSESAKDRIRQQLQNR